MCGRLASGWPGLPEGPGKASARRAHGGRAWGPTALEAEPQARPPCCMAFPTDLGADSCPCGTSHTPWRPVSYRTQLLAPPHPGMALPGHTATIDNDRCLTPHSRHPHWPGGHRPCPEPPGDGGEGILGGFTRRPWSPWGRKRRMGDRQPPPPPRYVTNRVPETCSHHVAVSALHLRRPREALLAGQTDGGHALLSQAALPVGDELGLLRPQRAERKGGAWTWVGTGARRARVWGDFCTFLH